MKKFLFIFVAVLVVSGISFAGYWFLFSENLEAVSSGQSDAYDQEAIEPSKDKKKFVLEKTDKGEYIIGWRILYQLNYKTGEGPSDLLKLNGEKVRLPGFIVPLSDEYTQLDEFLVVPDAQSCVHVPPPPPNLIVHVKLDEAIPASEVYNPAWISGTLKIEKTNSIYGAAAYRMYDVSLEEFKY